MAQLLDETTTRRVYIYGIQDDNGTDVQNFSLDLTPPPDVIMKTSPGTSEGMNVLGIVIFSATMGERERESTSYPPGLEFNAFFSLSRIQESCWEEWGLTGALWSTSAKA